MPAVAGIDSSTQSCKVVIRDAETGALLREGRANHPEGTEVDPRAWWVALGEAISQAGGLDDVRAVSVGAQQHGMVCLDERGVVVRPALLWNDTRSARAAADLVIELGAESGAELGAEPGGVGTDGPSRGAIAWARAVGSVPVASFTVTKLRWLAEHETEHARATAAVCLPHDWLTWRLRGDGSGIAGITTDRGDASGTGYWSARSGEYRLDLLERALGTRPMVPTVLGPAQPAGIVASWPGAVGTGARNLGGAGAILGPGTGDNAAAALGVGAVEGDVIISVGTSGTVFSVSGTPAADATGAVAGFADATGLFLPLVCTLNAARVLDAAAAMLGVDHATLSTLALSTPAGADGLVLIPYLEGERTPNRPDATGALHGLRLATSTPAHLARAAVEGMLCALADGLDALVEQGCVVRRVVLIGGGSRSTAVRQIAPTIFGVPVVAPPAGEYVADGAARQAAWVLLGTENPPQWTVQGGQTYEGEPCPRIRHRYAEARDLVVSRVAAAE